MYMYTCNTNTDVTTPSYNDKLRHFCLRNSNLVLEDCLAKRLTNEKVVTITWQSNTIYIHGSVLQSLKQPWEATLIVSEMLD